MSNRTFELDEKSADRSFVADVCVYGATLAGVAAAIEVERQGGQALLVVPDERLGCGVTSLTEVDGPTLLGAPGGLVGEFLGRIGAHYGGPMGPDPFEAEVGEQVIAAWLDEAGVDVVRGFRLAESPGAVEMMDGRVASIVSDCRARVGARVFIDATVEGDLLVRAGVTTVTGPEGNAAYGETLNGAAADSVGGAAGDDAVGVPGEAESGQGQDRVLIGRRMVSDYVLTEADVVATASKSADDPVAVAGGTLTLGTARRLVRDGKVLEEGGSARTALRPFGISFRALCPRRAEALNLLTPTCLSASFVGYSATCSERIRMTLGQVCGTAAVLANERKIAIQNVDYWKLRQKLTAGGLRVSA